ncbi:IS256 family transposase, partial [Acinetobacter baumannii]
RFSRKGENLCHRGGSEKTSLLLDGAKYSMQRPRARRGDEEVELPTLARLQDRDLLDDQMLARIMRGTSTRNYEGVIGGFARKTGISRSSV